MYKIVFSKDNAAVWVKYSGIVTIPTIIAMIHELASFEKIPAQWIVLSDYRDCHIDDTLDLAKIEAIVNAVTTQFANKLESLQWANLTAHPLPAAGAMLVQNRLATFPFIHYKLFSTEEAACAWLGIDKSIYPA